MAKQKQRKNGELRSGVRVAGWREWVSLPDLGVRAIKAKLDTGARSSALHAFGVERTFDKGAPLARMRIHPLQRDTTAVIEIVAPIIDERVVSDSGGHREKRIVIESTLEMGTDSWPIELTVTDRDSMLFRLLIGRTALAGRVVVDSEKSYVFGKRNPVKVKSTEN